MDFTGVNSASVFPTREEVTLDVQVFPLCSRLIKDKQPISCQSEHKCFNLNLTEITLRHRHQQDCILVRMQTRGRHSVGCSPGSPDCLRNSSVCRQNLVSAGSEVGHRQSAVCRDDQHAGAHLSTRNCREITFIG